MHAVLGAAGSPGPAERAFAGVAAVLAGIALLFWPTSASMVSVWSGSATYSHGFIVVPAFLWMVWGRRHALAALPREPSWWAVPLLLAAGLVWLLGGWLALALPSQLALVAMLPAALAGVFGGAWVRSLLFPLGFLLFAVPFGESLVPVLMDWTADFTVTALRLSGVPVYRDGLHFEIPSGRWSVVDSCSGIRYVFACLTLASLYGWVVYRGNLRRLMFLVLALAIAIVANWVRAYAIVLLGHLSNNEIATGADHLVYGAVFFVLVMALVFAAGRAWREAPPAASGAAAGQTPPRAAATPRTGATIASLAALLLGPLIALGSAADEAPATITLPDIRPAATWRRADAPLTSWRPLLHHPAAVVSAAFTRGDTSVGLHIGLFGRSTPEAKLASAQNRLLEPDGLDPHWKLAQQGSAPARWSGSAFDVNTGVLVGSEARLLAWQWYWVDGTVTANPLRATALQLLARLRGRPDVSAWITIYTRDTEDPGRAARVLQDFARDMAAPIDAALRRGAQRAPSSSQRSSAASSSSSICAWRCCAAIAPFGSFT